MHDGSSPATAVAPRRASGCRPRSSAASRLATRIAAAPSLIPDELPAVTVPPDRNAGRSRASPSGVTSGRGCSSRETISGSPLRWGTSTGTISASNRPSDMAWAARRWLSAAKASCSSRVIPCRSATISAVSPREMVHSAGMRGLVNRHPIVVSAESGAARGYADSGFRVTHGARDMLSTPPAMNTSPSPHRMACPALTTDCSPEPHSRFTVCPATSTGRPARREDMRATLRLSSPAWFVQPITTSSTRSVGTPVRRTSSAMAVARRSSGRTRASAPPCRPTGVRTAPQISASLGSGCRLLMGFL